MALDEASCREMIQAADAQGVKLMIAYRLHFDRANLQAVELARSGRIGEPRLYSSTFTMQVRDEENVRLSAALGGGTLFDIGIYCINAARSLFRAEPEEVVALSARGPDPRFREIDEMTSAILRFPGERLASFSSSFGAHDVASYRLVGTEGDVELLSVFEHSEPIELRLRVRGKTRVSKRFRKHDQFAPEIIHFATCIREGTDPEPSGEEGLADVRVITALLESARTGMPVSLPPMTRSARPTIEQAMERPGIRKPELVNATSPSEG
jgi:glucose-fructose oxidoreductase